jgi:Protein of unknown function (DUF1559)
MHCISFLLLALVSASPATAGESKYDADALAKTIAPFRDEQAFAVVHIDLTRVDVDKLRDKLIEITKENREEITRDMAFFGKKLAAFKDAGGKDVFMVFSLADMPELPFVVVPLHEGTDVEALLRLRAEMHLFPGGKAEKIGNALVAGSKRAVARLRTLKAEPYPDLARAFAAAGDSTMQVLLLPSASSRQIVEQLLPTLPRELGGGPSTVLTRGIQWAAAGQEATPKMQLRLVIQSEDTKAAQKLHDWIVRVLKRLAEVPDVQRAVPDFARIASTMTPKIEGDRLTLNLDETSIVAALLPAIQKVRTSAGIQQSINNMKQIALAMHSYHDVNKNFPAHAIYGKDGKPLLSWRVQILPYIEQDQLYKQFHLDEPWDSEHNRPLIAKMPKVYASPLSRLNNEGKTVYLVPVGKDTVFPPRSKGTRIQDILDGTSNTIWLVEAADSHAVEWTKPADLEVNMKNPLAGLTDGQRKAFAAAFADGSVRMIPVTIPPATLWAAFTRNGGEVIDWNAVP